MKFILSKRLSTRVLVQNTDFQWPPELEKTSLMLQIHPTLGSQEMNDACKAVVKVMAVAAGER